MKKKRKVKEFAATRPLETPKEFEFWTAVSSTWDRVKFTFFMEMSLSSSALSTNNLRCLRCLRLFGGEREKLRVKTRLGNDASVIKVGDRTFCMERKR